MSRRPPRLPPSSYFGPVIGFFTFCVHLREPFFINPVLCEAVLKEFRQATAAREVALIAYCLMPDHAHLLGQMMHGNILQWVDACKQRSAFQGFCRGIRPLWQDSYVDRMLRSEDSMLDVAAYILANPVRAGLAREIGEYPWAGSDVYSIADLKSAMQVRPSWW